jgi:hypothetical protein
VKRAMAGLVVPAIQAEGRIDAYINPNVGLEADAPRGVSGGL